MRLPTIATIVSLVFAFNITSHAAMPCPRTLPPGDITTNQAALHGTMPLNARAASRVTFQIRKAGRKQWRTELPWQRLGRGQAEITFSRVAAHLVQGTEYEVRAVAILAGVRRNGEIASFESISTNPVVTGAAEAISATSTRLNGTIDAAIGSEVPFHFAYGGTTDYEFTNSGTMTITSNRALAQVTVTGLVAGATYHYKLFAGDIGSGKDETFMQGRIGPPCVLNTGADSITPTSARLTACINPKSFLDTTAYFEWGTNTRYDNTRPIISFPGGGIAPVSCDFSLERVLTNLYPGATYHYRVVVTNAAGTFGSIDAVFTTPELPGNGTVVTGGAEVLSPTSVRLNGIIDVPENPNVPFGFAYGLTTNYDLEYRGMVAVTSGPMPVQATLTGLVAGVTYHYKLFAYTAGSMLSGEDATFATSLPITLEALPADLISQTGARIRGMVRAPAPWAPSPFMIAHFQWGTTTGYGMETGFTVIASNLATNEIISALVSGLTPGTTYHYRVVASNEAGLVFSGDSTFTTLPDIIPAVTAGVVLQRGGAALLTGSVNPRGISNTMAYFEWGPSNHYGEHSGPLFLPPATWPIEMETLISGLATGVVYHYRLVASNLFSVQATADQTFQSFEPLQLFEGETWTYHFENLPFDRTTERSGVEPEVGLLDFSVTPGGFSSNALLLVEMFESGTNSAAFTNSVWSWSTNLVTFHPGAWRDKAGTIRFQMLQGNAVISSLAVGASFLSGGGHFMDWYGYRIIPHLEDGEYQPARDTIAPARAPDGE